MIPEIIVNCDCGMLNVLNEDHFITYSSVNCRHCRKHIQVPNESEVLATYEYLEEKDMVRREMRKEMKDSITFNKFLRWMEV